ncbi:hypothetical protein [Endozoicomonas euniceicola]|uniref:Transposase DDE domain-containing protein n=1 Tax=Endozoicomonas euniceicola TaxID=1234143 RepID=A0ABY6GRT7_9GAMM|nr:hypothetical protein [Endozoicomonas euniceicola]UYM15287.1 hypothetical protein NX720_20890 [Endozoicomonas euniceicola]
MAWLSGVQLLNLGSTIPLEKQIENLDSRVKSKISEAMPWGKCRGVRSFIVQLCKLQGLTPFYHCLNVTFLQTTKHKLKVVYF